MRRRPSCVEAASEVSLWIGLNPRRMVAEEPCLIWIWIPLQPDYDVILLCTSENSACFSTKWRHGLEKLQQEEKWSNRIIALHVQLPQPHMRTEMILSRLQRIDDEFAHFREALCKSEREITVINEHTSCLSKYFNRKRWNCNDVHAASVTQLLLSSWFLPQSTKKR